jgi:hypothetical protein
MAKLHWIDYNCSNTVLNPLCVGKYCEKWSWSARRSDTGIDRITWRNTKKGNSYEATWREPTLTCTGAVIADKINCNINTAPFVWNVNIPGIDYYYNDVLNKTPSPNTCSFTSMYSRNNILYLSTSTGIQILSSDYNATPVIPTINASDLKLKAFGNISGLTLDSVNKLYVLDKLQNKVFCYKIDLVNKKTILFTDWGNLGGRKAQTRLNNPNDIYIDYEDYVWVTDTGNACIKKYSNTGAWLATYIDDTNTGYSNPPLSLTLDSSNYLHVLTNNGVFVYDNAGNYQFNYTFNQYTTLTPKKIITNFNKEITYILFDNIVLKYFRNGVFAGYAISNVPGLSGMSAIYHDEFRNLLVTFGENIYKDIDLMKLHTNTGDLSDLYWSLNDILINKEEYIQNWVYNKTFHRLWDNIEMIRNTIIFGTAGYCSEYTPPPHSKDKILIGQNEIVTSTVINRNISYLWDNYSSLLKYFDPNCKG